ncbi:MAG: hypothetical protein K2G45_11095 [Lachnospiraceae bacterium]|nr:hypothetical protein [Lachnospiraceae bacterium]
MNSFETDMKRAVFSYRFAGGVALMLWVLYTAGYGSKLYMVCVPVICTFPYTTAWLADYGSGYIKQYLPRTGVRAYIMGKIFACGISGGLVEVIPIWLFAWLKDKTVLEQAELSLVFASGVLWAVLAATLAALVGSRYVAYGGSFVIFYLLVILHERYFRRLYCLNPQEWLKPVHTWVFNNQGVLMLMTGFTAIFICIYYETLRRCMEHV